MRRAIEGSTEEEIRRDFQRREVSAFPPRKVRVDVSDHKPSGDPEAPIVVVVYADFECPYCNIATPALRRITREAPQRVVMYFKNFPVKTHEHSIASAKALIAADRQGRFFEMLDVMYRNSSAVRQCLLEKTVRWSGHQAIGDTPVAQPRGPTSLCSTTGPDQTL